MRAIFQKIHFFLLDILFPIKCAGCQKEGFWICPKCAAQIYLQTEHVCGVCEKVFTPDGRTCLACKKKSSLDALVPAALYSQGCVAKAVHFYKYRFVQELHLELGDLIIKSLQKTDLPIPDVIVPIPLHARRLRWRGFNQSSLLAVRVAEKLLPLSQLTVLENVLVRRRYTHPQMEIKNYQNRQQNLSGAFGVPDPAAVHGKTVLLIDDVATTGSTIFECAKALKSAGASQVYAAVIARQTLKPARPGNFGAGSCPPKLKR